jgi:hypothetical protein
MSNSAEIDHSLSTNSNLYFKTDTNNSSDKNQENSSSSYIFFGEENNSKPDSLSYSKSQILKGKWTKEEVKYNIITRMKNLKMQLLISVRKIGKMSPNMWREEPQSNVCIAGLKFYNPD